MRRYILSIQATHNDALTGGITLTMDIPAEKSSYDAYNEMFAEACAVLGVSERVAWAVFFHEFSDQ